MIRRSKNQNQRRGWKKWAVVMGLCVVLAQGACAMDDMDAAGATEDGDSPGTAEKLHAAERQLEEHRVDEARSLYESHLEEYPGDGQAAAGLGITDLLLMMEMEEMTQLFVDYLGASSGLDANALIYAEGGYLYWRSRGARWIDDGQSGAGSGVLTLLEDELPWEATRLTSLAMFVDGLDEPVHPMIRQLRIVANALQSVDELFGVAIDDGEFHRIYIPGEVFHDSDLAIQLGPAELSMLRGGIALARGAVLFMEAYEHDWTLEEALGLWRLNVGLDDPAYVPGFGPADYTMEYLDGHLFREVANPDRLAASRSALREGIGHLRTGLHYGVEQSYSTTLAWEALDEDDAYAMDLFLEAMADALDGPTPLPHRDSVTVDLSLLFEDGGRTLHEEIEWFERHVGGDSMDGAHEFDEMTELWTISDDAQAFWLDGVVDPVPESANDWADLAGPEGGVAAFVDLLIGDYWEDVEDVYLQTR